MDSGQQIDDLYERLDKEQAKISNVEALIESYKKRLMEIKKVQHSGLTHFTESPKMFDLRKEKISWLHSIISELEIAIQ